MLANCCKIGALLSLFLSLALSPAAADDMPQAARLSPRGFAGALLMTMAETPDSTLAKRWLKAAGGEEAKIAVIKLGAAKETDLPALLGDENLIATTVNIADRAAADDEAAAQLPAEATAVWLVSAGDPAQVGEMLVGTRLQARVRAWLAQDRAVALSGPVALLAGEMYLPHDAREATPALGWLSGVVVGSRVDVASGESRWQAALGQSPSLLGVELPGRGTLLVQSRTMQALGETPVKLLLAKSAARDERHRELEAGETADYNEWLRAARGRGADAFPAAACGAPEVPHGALVIIGGGGMPEEIGKRFVELGGGADGRFVALPTAMPDPLRPDGTVRMLEHFGAKHVTVIAAREQRDLETPENLAALREATGIWFGGGRQWRFIDAYEGTQIEKLFHDVLRRGGVIGGSSAGATIQGEYLVRGAPAGPHIMMCEGYERGLGFLPGTAIDQHFSERKRFDDMTALMKVYPQFLGIGIDEATAIVVQGRTAEVLGKGAVHFYDRRRETPAEAPDYETVRPGERYDLKERRVLEAATAE